MAREIFEGLRDRLRVFFYPDRQAYLVGTDGEAELAAVFRREARLVVVLYRENWGETPWTRIEERAIRERGFRQEDYDSFLVVLVVGQKKELPDWLPSIVIYFDPLKDGVGTAVTVIETRLRGLGKDVQPESASEKAKRIDRQLEWEAKRREILFQNRDSVKFANNEARAFLTTLVTRVKEISDGSGSLSISARETGGQYGGVELSVYSARRQKPLVLLVSWWVEYLNSTEGSALTADLLAGLPRIPQRLVMGEPDNLGSRRFEPDLLEPDIWGWRETARGVAGRFFSGEQLREELLSWLLGQLESDLDHVRKLRR